MKKVGTVSTGTHTLETHDDGRVSVNGGAPRKPKPGKECCPECGSIFGFTPAAGDERADCKDCGWGG